MAIHVNQETVADTPCPKCHSKSLRIEMRLKAKPIGTWSLSGNQLKVSAVEWPWLVCGNCGVEAAAKEAGE